MKNIKGFRSERESIRLGLKQSAAGTRYWRRKLTLLVLLKKLLQIVYVRVSRNTDHLINNKKKTPTVFGTHKS